MTVARYPDPGGLAGDRERLQHAVHFATAQRAHAAHLLYQRARQTSDAQVRLFLAIDAFEEKMTATEDTIGWLLALHDWIPGLPDRSLYKLLDRINVNPRAEDRAWPPAISSV